MPRLLAHQAVDENLRFLILEVRKQLDRTRRFISSPSGDAIQRIYDRDDYIDNLKSIIQRKCFNLAAKAGPEESSIDVLKAVDIIAVNLERIADFCERVIDQQGYVRVDELLRERDFGPFFDEVAAGLDRIWRAAFQRDVQTALAICRVEYTLDRMYAQAFQGVLDQLNEGKDPQTLVTLIFIYHYFERMGDSLLNIGEAIMSACLGEPIKIGQFRALESSLERSKLEHSIGELELEHMAETRSGCRINRVRRGAGDGERSLIFKEGRLEKLEEERTSIERWQEVRPDLVPRIFSFHAEGETGSILFEYLQGHTFEELLIRGDAGDLDTALERVQDTLVEVWQETKRDEPARADFLSQLTARLSDVYAVHSRFRRRGGGIGPARVPSLEELIEDARPLERHLDAPFSVLVHGDFNVDNVIYDPAGDRIHFIDLHRSRMFDYVQDVSVFIVSNHRLQVFESHVRRRINDVIARVHAFGRDFARRHGDATFEARLALGLARSLATSTRFVLDEGFAKSMFLRARYLLQHVVAHDVSAIADYEVPREVFVD